MRAAKVLIVDDEETYREALRAMLSQEAFQVEVAASGAEGVQTATAWVPDVVLLDLNMPEMDGYVAASLIRQHEATAEVPIVAMTGLDRPENVLRALLAGFNLYVSKPSDRDELVGAIASVLQLAERRRRFYALRPKQEGFLTIGEEQEQILEKLHDALLSRMPADVMAIAWRRPDDLGLLILSKAVLSENVVCSIEDQVWAHVPAQKRPEPVLVLGDEEEIAHLGGQYMVPLMIAEDSHAALLVASTDERGFDASARRVLDELGPQIAQLCETSVVGPALHEAVDELVSDIEVLLVHENDAKRWAAAMASAVGGIRVFPVSCVDELAPEHMGTSLALVDEAYQGAYEARRLQQMDQAGPHLPPAIPLYEHQLSDSKDRLAAFLLMSVLIGIMDARATGCLHVLRQGGKAAGLLVFRKGRLAWASSQRAKGSLLAGLADMTGQPIEALREVVATCLRTTGRGFGEAAVNQGLVTQEQYEEALRIHFTVVVGELLALSHPHLLWSKTVSVHHGSVTFDTAEIAMSSFVGS